MQYLISFLYLLIELAVIGFIGWLIIAAMGLLTFIPGGIQAIIKNIVYFIVVIVSLLLIIGWLVSIVGGGSLGFPVLPFAYRR